jgi:hypothetical protein
MAKYDKQGREIPDPNPIELPGGFNRPPTLQEQIKRFIRAELSRQAADDGDETFEEADDFDVDEDPDPLSGYEIPEAVPEWPGGVKDEDADPPLPPGSKSPETASGGARSDDQKPSAIPLPGNVPEGSKGRESA